jgi:hypothetical protein
VTERLPTPVVRRAARALALTPALLVTGAAGAAFASPPNTWQEGPPVSALHVILVLAIPPLALFVIITLLTYLPSMSRNAGYHPGEVWRYDAQWFGGPRGGVEALDAAEQPALSHRTENVDEPGAVTADPTRGGASGRW